MFISDILIRGGFISIDKSYLKGLSLKTIQTE